MTKYKCDVCGEKHDKIHIFIECGTCYMGGLRRELEKILKKRRRWTREELRREFK